MAYQITKVRKELSYSGGTHTHIAAVELADGTRYTREQVVSYINQGVEFYTYVNYVRARVFVRQCPRCYMHHYLTTTPDGTTSNNLDNLPQF